MIRFVARTYPPCWVLKAQIQKHRGKPLLFHNKCPGFFYVHYTTHGTYSFTSHPKDEAIMVKCLAQGHKRRDRPGRDSNPHSGNTRTWVQCTRPLGHNTPKGVGALKKRGVQKKFSKGKGTWPHLSPCIQGKPILICTLVLSVLKFQSHHPDASVVSPSVLLVPSAAELQKLEQASVAASEVTNTVLTQRLQLDEKDRSVKMLQKALVSWFVRLV